MYDSLNSSVGSEANCVPLSPVSFLSRTADVYPQHTAVVYGEIRRNWQQTEARIQAMASAIRALELGAFPTVSLLAFNTPELFEAHYFVPLAGGVINTINTRLDADTLGYIFNHAETKILVVDRELLAAATPGLRAMAQQGKAPTIILIDDPCAATKPDIADDIEVLDFEQLIEQHTLAAEDYRVGLPQNELDPLSINFTSGTSGRPKAVVYHHRGSYLMSMGTIAGWGVPIHPNYLYIVPMFHCNGWGHAWTMTAMAGTIVCVRSIEAPKVFKLIKDESITHFGGAPIVLNMLASSPDCPEVLAQSRSIYCMTAGAPPPAPVLAKMASLGVDVMHVYGLTETYGHILQAAAQREWSNMSKEKNAELKSRQGVRLPMTQAVQVIDENGNPVNNDGQTMGEIVVRGNTVMSGYLKDPEATAEALKNGWFYSGDLAVIHPDGYIQIKDRAKDIIISGGENISSVEIESALYKHPAVAEAAVVAMSDEKWGETPCAFVELKPNTCVSETALIEHCLGHLARFKKPSKVIFGALPKTATGKIQKHQLRARLKAES